MEKSRKFVCLEKLDRENQCMVPTWTGKMGEYFPVREKSGNFAKTGKVLPKILEKSENAREICQPVIVKTLQIWYHTVGKKRELENCENYWKFVSLKKWEP